MGAPALMGAESSSALRVAGDVEAQIAAALERGWRENGVTAAREATGGEWCRRVYLDLIGRIPTLAELEAFESLPARDRRRATVDQLLGSEYEEEYARHWSSVWCTILIGRTGGTASNSATSRAGMTEYLLACFRENRPYNVMVRELATARGGTRPEMENFNGATNFLAEKLSEGGVQATAKTAQIFLGMSVQCTQCHNHPFNEYRQNQFWELNAFFRQTTLKSEPYSDDDPTMRGTVADVDFGGEGRRGVYDERAEVFLELRDGRLVDRDAASVHAAPIFYELRNGQVQVAYPVFVDGASLAEKYADRGPDYGNSGRISEVDRRAELADLIVASADLERALVNRMWAHFFGYGFTRPIDDMGPHNPASHPELLAELASAVRQTGFDLKQLMRWIALSKPYGLSSRMAGKGGGDPAAGETPLFQRFYLRQMTPEQLYESLLAATQIDASLADSEREATKRRWLDQLSTTFGNDEGLESTTFNGTIPQALAIMNGELVERACRLDNGSFLDRVANDASTSNRDKIQRLYRAALGRVPTNEETSVCNELLAQQQDDVAQTLQDIWWAVLNSNEFILVH